MPHEDMPEEEVLSVDDVMERGLEKLTQVGFFCLGYTEYRCRSNGCYLGSAESIVLNPELICYFISK